MGIIRISLVLHALIMVPAGVCVCVHLVLHNFTMCMDLYDHHYS